MHRPKIWICYKVKLHLLSPKRNTGKKKILACWFMDFFNTRHVENHHQYIASPLLFHRSKRNYISDGTAFICRFCTTHVQDQKVWNNVIHLGLICPYKFLKHWIIWKSCRLLVKWIYDSSAMWFTSMKDVGKIKFTVSQRTPSLRHLPCLSSDFSFLFFFFFCTPVWKLKAYFQKYIFFVKVSGSPKT